MADDLKIPIRLPGATDAKRDLKEIAEGERQVGQAARESGRKAKTAKDDATSATSKLVGAVKGLVASYVGLAGAMKALAVMKQAHEQAAEAAMRHADAMRALLALSSLQGERAETIQSVRKMAVAAGRPIGQVGDAYYTLLGGTAGMDRGRQQGLMQQALLMGRTDPTASLESLVNLFSTLGTQAPGLTPGQLGNLASKTIEQAKSTGGEMAAYLPDVLTAARAGGVGPDVAAAMFSFTTRAGGGVAKAGTAAKSALMGLLAPGRETAKVLRRAGMPEGSLMAKVGWLASNADRLPEDVVAALGGRRGIQAVSAIAADQAGFQAEMGMMAGALTEPGSLLQGRLEGMFGEVPAQRIAEQARQIEVMTDIEKASPEASRAKMRIGFRALLRREQGEGEIAIRANRWLEETSAGTILGLPQGPDQIRAMEALLDEGYQVQDVMAAFKSWGGRPIGGNLAGPGGEWVTAAQATDAMRARLRGRGVTTMQGTGPTIVGGTVYINADKADPAGKPVAPAIQH